MYAPIGSPDFVRISQALDLAIKTDLQNLRDWYFDCLLVCTGVVGLGVFMEGFEILHDMWGIFWRKSIELTYWMAPSIDRKKYRAPDWMKLMAGVGWVLIVMGIAGEGVYEGLVSKYDGALSTLNDTLITETQKETALALAQAVHADMTASGFNLLIAEARRDAAESKKKTETERLERVKLEAQLAPRRLSSKQMDELATKLKTLSAQGQVNIAISSAALDAESADFAKDFETAFKAGGWKPTIVGWDQMGERGLDVGMLSDPFNPKHIPAAFTPLVQYIHDAIIGIGIQCRILPLSPDDPISLSKPEKGVLYLLVHRKPEVVLPDKSETKKHTAKSNKMP
jgi:hypothetical protein